MVEERISICVENLVVTDNGLSLAKNGEVSLLNAVFVDEEGFFIHPSSIQWAKREDKCPHGHVVWCQNCWGCGFWGCNYQCTCKVHKVTNNSNCQITDKCRLCDQRIAIKNNELFLIKNGEIFPLTAVFHDGNGLFIRYSSIKLGKISPNNCPNGHSIWCKQCGGCGFWPCPFCCKCNFQIN
jgi:hypothetical protein